jgi:hypothetical protein
MSEQINDLVVSIKSTDVQVQEMTLKIKGLYETIQEKFTESKNIRTKEIDQFYKDIDSTFNAKSKLEASVVNMKKQILNILLG